MTTRRRAFNMPSDAQWLEECPPFFDDIPQWHADFFSDKERQYISTPKKHLSDTAISLKQVNRYMSLYRVMLLVFPYPALAGRRNQFKHAIEDAVRLNGFQLKDFRGQMISANELACRLYFDECDDVYVDLDSLEEAAKRGWLYDYGFYVPIWRRYVEEKEAHFQQEFAAFQNHQSSLVATALEPSEPLNQVVSNPLLEDESTHELLSQQSVLGKIQWVLKAPERERDVYFLFERLVSIHGTEAINPSSLWAIIFSGDARLSSFVEIVSYSAEMPTRAIFKDKVANRERDFKWFEKAFKRLFVRLEIKGN